MLNDVSKWYRGIAFTTGHTILEFEKVFKVINHFLGQTKHLSFMMHLMSVMWIFQKL
jgi:hypothetical protein